MWDIPKAWSLRDAATVPVAYLTAYYALVMRGGLEKGHKVLVHSGTGAVGLAAIRICLHRGCEVRLCRTRLFGNRFTLSPFAFASGRILSRQPARHEGRKERHITGPAFS